jgi:hypothetical protein
MRWKEILTTCGKAYPTNLPIICSTIGQPKQRLWMVDPETLFAKESSFFGDPGQRLRVYDSIKRHQATCFSLVDPISRFYLQHTRKRLIPAYLSQVGMRWLDDEREGRESRLDRKQKLESLFDLIDPGRSGDDLKSRVEIIAQLLSPDDPENPLLKLAHDIGMLYFVPEPEPHILEVCPDNPVPNRDVNEPPVPVPVPVPHLNLSPQDPSVDCETKESDELPLQSGGPKNAEDLPLPLEVLPPRISVLLDRLSYSFSAEIPFATLLQDLPFPLLEPLIPNIVFYGSQEHGTTQLMEHLIGFPLPQEEKIPFEVFLRPDAPDASVVDRIEVLDENHVPLTNLCVPIGAKSDVDELYRDLYDRVVDISQQREQKTHPWMFTFRVHLYSSQWPLLNLLFFPLLHCSKDVGSYISDRNEDSYFCFVVSSMVSIRSAEVSNHFIRRSNEVRR